MLTTAARQRHFHRPCCIGGEIEAQGIGVICTRLLSKKPVKWGTQTLGIWAPCWGPMTMTTEWGQISSQMGKSGAGGQGGERMAGSVRPPCRPDLWGLQGLPGLQDCSQPAWSSHSDLLHPPPSFCCRRGEPARLAMSGRGQEEQSPVLVPNPGLLHPRLLLAGPQPAGERGSSYSASPGRTRFPGCAHSGRGPGSRPSASAFSRCRWLSLFTALGVSCLTHNVGVDALRGSSERKIPLF